MSTVHISRPRFIPRIAGTRFCTAVLHLPPLLAAASLLVGTSAWASGHDTEAADSAAHPHLEQRFAQLDTDGDGRVSQQEFEDAKPPREHARGRKHGGKGPAGRHRRPQMAAAVEAEMFELLDTDGNGQISRQEHAAGFTTANLHLARQRAMFNFLDKDGDGQLTPTELPRRGRHHQGEDHP